MRLERVKNLNTEMLNIKPDSIGYKIMKDKTQILGFKIDGLKLQAMQILKQDAISVGAELVTPRDAILCEKKSYDCLLFGSLKSLKLLSLKMQRQPFGLKSLSRELRAFIQTKINDKKSHKKSVMSIINVESNSFYKEFSVKDAIEKIHSDIELGADIIDIGAASSRPNADIIESKIEIKRLNLIFKEVSKIKTNTQFSIDTYNAETADIALNSGFNIINDISGNVESMSQILKKYPKSSYILMHIRGNPKTMQNDTHYENLLLEIDKYFEEKLRFLHAQKINNVILDVGIGFGKSAEQNVELIAKLRHFKHFRKPLLMGLSHKSFLGKILGSEKDSRLIASVIADFIALMNGADIIRTHDLKEHLEMLKIYEAFEMEDCDLM
ncbi:dihydropteroate synthase [Helicobacter saguini]|uniref:dihydropteroate synthase n=1 Tax=Helicobacter saguini TaxID=1548018 RepID=A0A347VP77_9HELI|nr:dihydropteroate synthase [Helicobacter saguini]MWV61479.1 dihydropteroate synthase [Helicobacter saguini]MWV67850.1 dihydropteroate synthase [Helicobacter saguini]MWV70682.1 dihydropteroate synthase [Helicobacter saguini]MWV72586.1 dihydropteroate synthase [Helicobacter saguini]TLD94601.1 dihydropteroate synthase [Helicobacter saguini]